MNLHYSQTDILAGLYPLPFYYLMNLHYSQTWITGRVSKFRFYYLMNLHYSQTSWRSELPKRWFYYLMNLHYSQTLLRVKVVKCGFTTLWIYTILKPASLHTHKIYVLLPYEFTLFSNCFCCIDRSDYVLLPYEFTLFSNQDEQFFNFLRVLLPYEFTLFSNLTGQTLTLLQFYYLMNLHYSQTMINSMCTPIRFTTLWIYTILKPCSVLKFSNVVLLPYEFTLFSNATGT